MGMEVKLIAYTPEPAQIAGVAAAICTASDSPQKSLKGALSCGHDSVVEHVSFTFRISGVSRVLLAQLTRHRIASFSVESQRYAGAHGRECIIPKSVIDGEYGEKFNFVGMSALMLYEEMVHNGVPEEDARYILPQGITTQLIMTMNARELGHFLSLRMCNRAQWEIREMADRIYEQVVAVCPEIFGKCGPGCVRGRCPEGKRACGRPRTEELRE